MKKSEQYLDLGRISKAPSRPVTALLTIAVTLVGVVLATPFAQAQTFTLLHSFQGPPLDGWSPNGELIFDGSGNLYGTTIFGGNGTGYGAGSGAVFEVDASSRETIVYSFTGTAGDGEFPEGPLVRYAGNIYGTTPGGGGSDCINFGGCGTIFEVSQGNETVVHTFTGLGGQYPLEGLARDASGNLYGTTSAGTSETPPPACGGQGCGTVFEMSQGQEIVLYSFGGMPDAATPTTGRLIMDRLGNLYGTASGGEFDGGTVFELSPNSDGTWTERLLYSFRGKSDGAVPAGLVMDAKGSLYGTTEARADST